MLVFCHLSENFFVFAEKANRLKAAKKEADTEINNYKGERERQYKEYEARVCSSLSYCLLILDAKILYC